MCRDWDALEISGANANFRLPKQPLANSQLGKNPILCGEIWERPPKHLRSPLPSKFFSCATRNSALEIQPFVQKVSQSRGPILSTVPKTSRCMGTTADQISLRLEKKNHHAPWDMPHTVFRLPLPQERSRPTIQFFGGHSCVTREHNTSIPHFTTPRTLMVSDTDVGLEGHDVLLRCCVVEMESTGHL